MMSCPRNACCATKSLRRQPRSYLLALLALLALLPCTSTAQAQTSEVQPPQEHSPLVQSGHGPVGLVAEPERALAPGPVRHLLVKALGQGATPEEAEQSALQGARVLAAKRLAALGGPAALDSSPEGLRVISAHRFPVLGISPARAVVLVEMRLRGLSEPPQAALALPSLSVTRDTGELVIEATLPCEVIVLLDAGKAVEPEILPGGGGAAFRLAPGKPLRQPLPKPLTTGDTHLRVLACTGGLNPPVSAASADEALAKSRIGRPHPATLQGVVSDCVEIQAGSVTGSARSMRQKSSETPVNMTGAAGRDAVREGGREGGSVSVIIRDTP